MTSENDQTLRERKKSQPSETKGQKVEQIKEDQRRPERAAQTDNEARDPMFGPMPTFPNQRFWARMLLLLGTLVVVYFTSGNERIITLAKQKEKLNHRRQEIQCSKDYLNELSQLLGKEKVRCGRIVMDSIITPTEAKQLESIAKKALQLTGTPAGGASILDLHSGALSAGKTFINFYALNLTIFNSADFALYKRVRRRVHETVAFSFDLPSEKLFLTKPTFFSRLTSKEPATPHDEYWHPHVDKETYGSFHYTSLIYLNDYGTDFEGGRFIFDDPENVTTIVEPRTARVLMFSSGKENVHRVERVTKGERFAITVSFTCDLSKAIADPSMNKFGQMEK